MKNKVMLLALLAVVSTPAVADNLFVPGQYGTIQGAVDAASPDDRIHVSAGSFDGAFINKRVSILGDGDQTVIINGPSAAVGPFFFQNGFQIATGGDGTQISDLTVELSPGAVGDIGSLELIQVGIFAIAVDKVAVRNVEFIGLNRGVDFRDSEKWRITDNTIEGLNASPIRQAVGISVLRSSESFIGFNTITHSSNDNVGKQYTGISLVFGGFAGAPSTENNKIIQNQVSVNAPGAVMANDISLADFSALFGGPVTVFNNKIVENDIETIMLQPPLLEDHNVIEQND